MIVDTLESDDQNAVEVPAALVASRGPFTWGATAPPPPHLLARHYTRKHGPDAYYDNPAPEPAV